MIISQSPLDCFEMTQEILTIPHQFRVENFGRTQTYRVNVLVIETLTCAPNAAELLPWFLFGVYCFFME